MSAEHVAMVDLLYMLSSSELNFLKIAMSINKKEEDLFSENRKRKREREKENGKTVCTNTLCASK